MKKISYLLPCMLLLFANTCLITSLVMVRDKFDKKTTELNYKLDQQEKKTNFLLNYSDINKDTCIKNATFADDTFDICSELVTKKSCANGDIPKKYCDLYQ